MLKYVKRFIVFSLIGALVFEGLGGRTTRGFGRFKPNIRNLSSDIDNISILEIFNKDYNNVEELKRDIIEFINSCREECKHIYKELSRICEFNIPLSNNRVYPTFSFGRGDYMVYVFRGDNNRNSCDLLKKIERAVMKSTWKKLKRGSIGIRECGRMYQTWILGLPRKSKIRLPDFESLNKAAKELEKERNIKINVSKYKSDSGNSKKGGDKGEIYTGYFELEKEEGNKYRILSDLRHKSPFQFTILKDEDTYWIVMFVFKNLEPLHRLHNSEDFVRIGVHKKKQNRIEYCIEVNKYGYQPDEKCQEKNQYQGSTNLGNNTTINWLYDETIKNIERILRNTGY